MDFEIFEIEFSAQEFKIEIEFEVLRSRFLIFREPKFFKNQNFGFDVSISHFFETIFF